MAKFHIGDVVKLRKQHPCGSFLWEVLRVGADFRIRCRGCQRVIMLPRAKFEKSVKGIVSSAFDQASDLQENQ